MEQITLKYQNISSVTSVIDSYGANHYNSFAELWDSGAGQSFIGDGKIIKKITFQLQRDFVAAPHHVTGLVTACIYSHAGIFGVDGVPDTFLALSANSVLATDIGGGDDNVGQPGVIANIDFDFNFTTIAGTHYFAVVQFLGGSYYGGLLVGSDYPTPIHPGNCAVSTPGQFPPLDWTSAGTRDLIFSIEGIDPPQPAKAFDALYVKGFDSPDHIQFIPPIIFNIVNGGKATEFRGFKRIITFQLAALDSFEDYIRGWAQASTKSLIYKGISVTPEEAVVILETPELLNEWLDDYEHTKQYTITVIENRVRQVFPNLYLPEVDNMTGNVANKIEITGTQSTPQTFTTNSGVLSTDSTGHAFPVINLASYVVSIVLPAYQDAKINQVESVTQSGSDITFQLAVSDTGAASSDGKYYCDIMIILQAKT